MLPNGSNQVGRLEKKKQGEAKQTLNVENKETLWVSFTDVSYLLSGVLSV